MLHADELTIDTSLNYCVFNEFLAAGRKQWTCRVD